MWWGYGGEYIKTAYFLLHIPSATISINQPKSRPGSLFNDSVDFRLFHLKSFLML